MLPNRDNTHEFYTERPRHWAAGSEGYTGADSLLTMVQRGWHIVTKHVYREDVLFRGARRSAIYHITLTYVTPDAVDETVMTVVSSPFLLRYLHKLGVNVNRRYTTATYNSSAYQMQSVLQIVREGDDVLTDDALTDENVASEEAAARLA